MNARIVETSEGRILLTELKKPVGQKTHCLELHRRVRDGAYEVSFMLLTADELTELRSA